MDAAYNLLSRYPPSFAKNEAGRALRDIDKQSTSKRTLRFVVYDIIYAFQRLEARRLGIRSDRHPIQYAEFRRNFVVALATWVPGKDPYIDGPREALSIAVKHNDPALNKILEDMIQHEAMRVSNEQRRRALSLRKPKPVDVYIKEALTNNPKLTLADLRQKMMDDERGNVIEEVTEDEVYIVGTPKPYSRGSIRNRYYDIRNKIKLSQ